ncbi:ComF family protein [Nibrella saemangeumensis]|uniref:ComF family protein n=1 Tax=Nibrella saemangeumensis TaxID=1084526 RepID=A0ABP8MYU6_9BACT
METLLQFIKRACNNFVDLLYPVSCLGCSENLTPNEEILCVQCRVKLPVTDLTKTSSSGVALQFAGKVPLDFAYSYLVFSKKGIVQRLIHQIKYKGQKEAGAVLGRWFGYELKEKCQDIAEANLLIGVPLHPVRERQRGFNQSEWIAKGLSEALKIPVNTTALKRTRFEASQTRKGKGARWENVKDVFAIADAESIQGKRVILIDDVLTTGATLEACASQLLKAGCASVGVLTLAAAR